MEWLALFITLCACGWVVYKMYQFFKFRNQEYENQMKLLIAADKTRKENYDKLEKLLQSIIKKFRIKIKLEEQHEEAKTDQPG